jgi:pantoate ligase/cytidylate kinase
MKTLRLFNTVAGLRSHLEPQRSQTIGLVPTMGALHLGHVSLIERAVAENDLAIVSIFVNPLQFSPNEDFSRYPRQLEQDCQLCERLGVKVIFAPSAEEMGTVETATTLVVPPAAMMSVLCAPFRAGHFAGVATIVTKLLNAVSPTVAYFGEKDAQQLAIIRRLVADLKLPGEIQACPTVREASGLACSSRNQYLSAEEKKQAVAISRSLRQAEQAFRQGERETAKLIAIARQELALTPAIAVQYVELVHPDTLAPLQTIEESGLLAIAAHLGSTRLIDNLILRQQPPIVTIDGPAGAGKSTVTRRIAGALNLLYLDTGAMYRAVTWLAMQSGIPLDDEGAIAELVSQATLELIPPADGGITRVTINGEDVTAAIRTPEVTANVSQVAAQAAVRRLLVQQQRRYGRRGGIVAEGRDMGTHVFPDADLKIFLTASVQERARRRLQDFQFQGVKEISLEQLKKDIQMRDEKDSQRQIAPLKKAVDAIAIDTDSLSIEAVTEKIIDCYRLRVGNGDRC